jgi:dihydroorotate dehydrogenase electron transfer subunit
MKKKQIKAEIFSNEKVKGRYRKMILNCPEIARSALPGQFVMLKVKEGLVPLLRRPLSIHRVSGAKIEMLYEIVGDGTRILAERNAGGSIDVLGPLGNGFNPRAPFALNREPILIAGGMGVAPLVFLAEKLKARKDAGSEQKPLVLIGARTKDHILCEKEFKKMGCDVKIATDDGSAGFSGRVSELLENVLQTASCGLQALYACGPHPMLKEIARISKAGGIACQASLEAHMACGIGACLGCVVTTKDGYKRVCKDGPVFETENLIY